MEVDSSSLKLIQLLSLLIIALLILHPSFISASTEDLRARVLYVAEVFEENGLVSLRFNITLMNPTSRELYVENLTLRIPALSGELIRVDALYDEFKTRYSMDLRRNLSITLIVDESIPPRGVKKAFVRVLYLGSAVEVEPESYTITLPKYPSLDCWIEEVKSRVYVPVGSLVTKPKGFIEVGTATEHFIKANFTNVGLVRDLELIKLWINESSIKVAKALLNREVVIDEYGEAHVRDEVLVINVGSKELDSIWYVKGNSMDFRAETILRRTLKHYFKGDLIRIELPRPIKSGEREKIRVWFKLKPSASKSGLFTLNLSGRLTLSEFPFYLTNGSISVEDFRGNRLSQAFLEKHYPMDRLEFSFKVTLSLLDYASKWIKIFTLSFLVILFSSILYSKRGLEKYSELKNFNGKLIKLLKDLASSLSSYLEVSEKFTERKVKLKSFISSSSRIHERVSSISKDLKSRLRELRERGLEELTAELEGKIDECMGCLREFRDLDSKMVRGKISFREYVYRRDALAVKSRIALKFFKKVLKAASS